MRLKRQEAVEVVLNSFGSVLFKIKRFVEKIPVEFLPEIANQGCLLTGGGVLVPGLSRLLSEETGLPMIVSQTPQLSIIQGLSRLDADKKLRAKLEIKDELF